LKTEPLIRVIGLGASFHQHGESNVVLHGLHFDISPGETLGIVGESGSGKSVSSMSILRLIPSPPIQYDEGSIYYGPLEIDLLKADESLLQSLRGNDISMIFQEPMTSLNPLKSCGDQVIEVFEIHKRHPRSSWKEKVLELFAEVQLPDPLRAYSAFPHELSGGQKQRIVIAMAIASEPKLLIADEPTTALDVTVQRTILELLKGIQKRMNMAMIFISHDLAVVSTIADRILVMKQGEIVEQGFSAQVIQSPSHDYTRALLASRPPQEGRPLRLKTVQDHLGPNQGQEILQETKASRTERHKTLYESAPVFEVQDLHTWYPIRSGIFQSVTDHFRALNGVSFNIYPGETLGVVGESGCGKSTLGRTLIGLEKAHSGQIIYKGRSVLEMDKKKKAAMVKEVQMIFQDPYSSLNPRQKVGEAILEPMLVHGIHANRKERIAAVHSLLKEVGLQESHFERYPHEFSGGQRQRICIARALAMNPEVIVCDESVSALDVSVQAQVLNLLNQLKAERGLSYLFISHDLSVVRYMSDRVMVMNKGECVEYGEADQMYATPKNTYTKKLVASAYALDSET
jgi:peptide/nickel transport system ATP-binding protein